MLLRFQKAAVRGNYETGNQAFSMRLRFLTIRGFFTVEVLTLKGLVIFTRDGRSVCSIATRHLWDRPLRQVATPRTHNTVRLSAPGPG